MIVFAGIVPTSPLLLPNVNKEHVHLADKTRKAMQMFSEELFATHPDVLVIFAAHNATPDDAFSMNIADPFHAKLDEFGDLGYQKTYHPDLGLADSIQRALRKNDQPFSLETEDVLPSSVTVPLDFLTQHLPHVRVLPIAPCTRDAKDHFDFGADLRDALVSSHKRIALLAAGDGPALQQKSGELNESGLEVQKKLSTIIAQKNTAGLLQMQPEILAASGEHLYRETVMLFGALDNAPVDSTVLSEESPFGFVSFVAEFRIL